jgi:uncharacterized protein (DUF924 family)
MSAHDPGFEPILGYWFGFDAHDPAAVERAYRRWFTSTPAADADIRARFAPLAEAAAEERLAGWRRDARGRLALVLVLDQLPRNLHRGSAQAFAQDDKALAEALEGIRVGADRELAPLERAFFYMPLQHSESIDVQRRSVDAFEQLAREPGPEHIAEALAGFADYARLHRDIIERFGRFPHRNQALGRATTAGERAFLDSGGPTFGQ